ncbi:MAG: uracil phosphoribosyltransferase [Cyclobacteriaceae bacterium]|nr:MAG: uracil phosphoribosyltransferase [Cyclobacteriaceae bacterium]
MVHNLGEQLSVAQTFLEGLRDTGQQTNRAHFRSLVTRLGELMAYEISKTLPYEKKQVRTPLGFAGVHILKRQPVLIAVMRAGLPYYEGFQRMFPQAGAGFIGAWRKEHEAGVQEVNIGLSYVATPSLEGETVILIDPMLATGKSFVRAAEALLKQGKPAHIHVAALIAAPEGVEFVKRHFPLPHDIWFWALDEALNQQYYIVPGLGDAGDLCFGEKL